MNLFFFLVNGFKAGYLASLTYSLTYSRTFICLFSSSSHPSHSLMHTVYYEPEVQERGGGTQVGLLLLASSKEAGQEEVG